MRLGKWLWLWGAEKAAPEWGIPRAARGRTSDAFRLTFVGASDEVHEVSGHGKWLGEYIEGPNWCYDACRCLFGWKGDRALRSQRRGVRPESWLTTCPIRTTRPITAQGSNPLTRRGDDSHDGDSQARHQQHQQPGWQDIAGRCTIVVFAVYYFRLSFSSHGMPIVLGRQATCDI